MKNQIRKVTIRLHKRHDLDLITFMDTHQMDFKKAVYCALTAFAKGEVFIIKIPPRLDQPLHAKSTYTFTLRLNSSTDAAVIQMIEDIENGYKNCFIKNLLRLYLCMPISVEFLKDKTKIDDYEQRFQIFKRGKRIADAARVRNLKVGKNAKNTCDRMQDIFLPTKVQKPLPVSEKERRDSYINEATQEKPDKPEPGSDLSQETEAPTTGSILEPKEMDPTEDLTDLFASLISE